jgi:hypothetical protein
LRCGSHRVDVRSWDGPNAARIACCACGHGIAAPGFMVARLSHAMPDEQIDALVLAVVHDAAVFQGPNQALLRASFRRSVFQALDAPPW